jgi:chorismate mutase
MNVSDKANQPDDLEAIRREIDAIDDGLLTLLDRRFQASDRVKAAKQATGGAGGSPFRPAREAAIIRRLLARPGRHVPADIMVRLWRIILTGSSRSQSPITICVSRMTATSMPARLAISDHFGSLPIEEYRDEEQALLQLETGSSDICIVETASAWAQAFMQGRAGDAQVFGCLPTRLGKTDVPTMLMIGHATSDPSGDDQTLLVSDGKLPRDFKPQPLWESKAGTQRLSCLPGYLSEHENPIVGLVRSNSQLRLKVAGRYPAPFGDQA